MKLSKDIVDKGIIVSYPIFMLLFIYFLEDMVNLMRGHETLVFISLMMTIAIITIYNLFKS